MGGTILPMQQPALITADVAASPLTLVVALPHLEPLAHFADALAAQFKTKPGSATHGMTSAQQQGEVEKIQSIRSQAGDRELLASIAAASKMVQPGLRQAVTAGNKCGVSEPGRVTACGKVFADNGDQLQVSLMVSECL